MIEPVEDRWRALLAHGEPESREVDAESQLRMLVGVSAVGRPYFAVITSRKPGVPDLTSAIEVTLRQRETDGRWTLTLELQVRALTDAFISLVSDLATKSAEADSEPQALAIFLDTLAEWQELLTARPDHLSESALRGLVAELWFGFQSQAHGHPEPQAARAWAGPLGGAQDFQFLAPSYHFEVKSLRPRHTSVEISSEEQLDGDNVKLAIVTLDEVGESPESITLPQLVACIRSKLKNGADRSEFNRRLARLLIDLDDPWYSEHRYHVDRLQVFDVGPQFPALRRSLLPDAVKHTKYHIEIQYLTTFLEVDMNYVHGSGSGHG